MATQVFGDTADGFVFDDDASWANLDVTGASLPSPGSNTVSASTTGITRNVAGASFFARQSFFLFDTSAVDASFAASFFIEVTTTLAGNEGTQTARIMIRPWGPTLQTSEYIASSQFASFNLVNTLTLADGLSNAYREIPFTDPSDVNLSGTTDIIMTPQDMATAPTDTTDEMAWGLTYADQTGTADDPYLLIEEEGESVYGADFYGPIPIVPPPMMQGY